MPEVSGSRRPQPDEGRTVRVAGLAGAQGGVVGAAQLRQLGVSRDAAAGWVATGRLHRIHRGVYAVGHAALSLDGHLHAALLLAGDGAALSHTTAGWWWQLIGAEPRTIHVSAPGDVGSARRVKVHHPRRLDVIHDHGMPVTTVPRTLLDLAGMLSFGQLRRAVAEADHRRLLDRGAVEAMLGRGQPGSAALGRALARHCPVLADTLSLLEQRFLALCEMRGIPLPEINVKIEGLMVDALWRERRVIVELDGHQAHAYAAAAEEDRRRELRLRAAGYRVHRYTWQQVTHQPEQVIADVRSALAN